MKDFVEKHFLTIPIRDLWEMEKKCFPLARKSVTYFYRNNLPLDGTFLKNWIPPNLNNAFHKQKDKALESVPSSNNVTF